MNGEPKEYNGDRSLEDMVEFVNNAAGTARRSDGTVDTSYGRIPEIDAILANIKTLSEENMAKVKEALEKVPEQMEANKKVYENLMKKIKEKGVEYLDTEKARIQRFLMSDSVSKLKKGAFRIRSNVLDAFNSLKPVTAETSETAEKSDEEL